LEELVRISENNDASLKEEFIIFYQFHFGKRAFA